MARQSEFKPPEISYRWQKELGDPEGKGVYFPVEGLRKLFLACDDNMRKTASTLGLHGCFYELRYNKHPDIATLVDHLIETLKEKGIKRIAYLDNGAGSLFFLSTPNRAGRQQLIGLTVEQDQYVDCPLMLPPIEHSLIESGNFKLQLRVMPALKTGLTERKYIKTPRDLLEEIRYRLGLNPLIVAKEHEKTLWDLLDAMHLPYNGDVSRHNIGMVEFTNKEGVKKCVPMLYDWNAVQPTEDLAELKKAWDNDPILKAKLADWYEAQEYLRKQYQIENTVTPKRTMVAELRESGFDSSDPQEHAIAIEAAEKHGLYAPEIAALAKKAQKGYRKTFEKRLEDRIEGTDPSKFHKG